MTVGIASTKNFSRACNSSLSMAPQVLQVFTPARANSLPSTLFPPAFAVAPAMSCCADSLRNPTVREPPMGLTTRMEKAYETIKNTIQQRTLSMLAAASPAVGAAQKCRKKYLRRLTLMDTGLRCRYHLRSVSDRMGWYPRTCHRFLATGPF